MYFSFLEALETGKLDSLTKEGGSYAMQYGSDVFDQFPEDYARLLNKQPDLISDFHQHINTGYVSNLINAKKPFTTQDIFPRFFNALTDDNKRIFAKRWLLPNAVEYADPEFLDRLLLLFSPAERAERLKELWEHIIYELIIISEEASEESEIINHQEEEYERDEPDIVEGFTFKSIMLRKLIELTGIEAIREIERKSERPFSVISEAARNANIQVLEALIPIIPDSATLKHILTDNPYRIYHVFSNSQKAKKIREFSTEEDFDDLIINHNGFRGIMRSDDLAFMEEMWNRLPPEKAQMLLMDAAVDTLTHSEISLRFIMNHVAPDNKMSLLKGNTPIPFEMLIECVKKEKFKELLIISDHLLPAELAEIAVNCPSVRPYIQDLVIQPKKGEQDIGLSRRLQRDKAGPLRWRAMLKMDPPHESLVLQSPFYFSPKRYLELLPICRRASSLESNSDAELHAYKLSVMFKNMEEVRKYVDKYSEAVAGEREVFDAVFENHLSLHDACLFNIPEQGLWTPKFWANFLQEYPKEGRKYTGLAVEIEFLLKEESLAFPSTLKEMQSVASRIIYFRQKENPAFAEVAHRYNLPDKDFDKCLDLISTQTKTTDTMPDIRINGDDIGHAGYYMERLAPDDPIGLILGKMLGCCQTVGEAGEKYAVHGFTSPNGGFYVWRKREGETDQKTDPIIAGSWAWISKNNALAFDSFERKDPEHNILAQPFIEYFAHLAKRHGFNAVRVGTGGNTPQLYIKGGKALLPRAEKPERWKDFSYGENEPAEFDSRKQYIITARNILLSQKKSARGS